MSLANKALMIALALVAAGCTTYGVVANKPLTPSEGRPGFSIDEFTRNLNRQSNELRLSLAFSGGGTRAAALSYGVLQELRDTRVRLDGKEQSLLEAVSVISSVSGGSFTSAYYGLYGDRIFVDFEERFLRRNVEGALLRGVLLNPLEWFSSHSRTNMAVSYYQQTLFGDATFADLNMIVNSDDAYEDKTRIRFAQFVDGGITDNLGLRAIVDVIEMAGGAKQFNQTTETSRPGHIAIISVNAAADTPLGIGATNQAPSIENTLDAVTNIQLHRYNVATVQQTKQSLTRWAAELSTPERPVTPYFIRLSFEEVPDSLLRRLLNEIPTSFALSTEQVDRLIATGRQLLRDNPEFQRLMASLQGQDGPVQGTLPKPPR